MPLSTFISWNLSLSPNTGPHGAHLSPELVGCLGSLLCIFVVLLVADLSLLRFMPRARVCVCVCVRACVRVCWQTFCSSGPWLCIIVWDGGAHAGALLFIHVGLETLINISKLNFSPLYCVLFLCIICFIFLCSYLFCTFQGDGT